MSGEGKKTLGLIRAIHEVVRATHRSEAGLSSAAKAVAIALVMADGHKGCYPGAARLARDTSLAKSTVWEAIGELEEKHFVSRVPRAANGRQTSNTYRLTIALGAAEQSARRTPPAKEEPSGNRTPGVRQPDAGSPVIGHDLPSDLPNDPPLPAGAEKEGANEGGGDAVGEVLACYSEAWTSTRGVKPAKVDKGAAASLLAKVEGDAPRACGIIRRALADRYWQGRTGMSLALIAKDPDRFTVANGNGDKPVTGAQFNEFMRAGKAAPGPPPVRYDIIRAVPIPPMTDEERAARDKASAAFFASLATPTDFTKAPQRRNAGERLRATPHCSEGGDDAQESSQAKPR